LGKSLCKMDSTHAHQWPKDNACSCCYSSAALEKYRQCIFQSHFNGWRVMDAFILPTADMTECWLACPIVTEEDCTTQSACSESCAHHVLQPKGTCAWASHINWYNDEWLIWLPTLAG
jgi:hypothetical protein